NLEHDLQTDRLHVLFPQLVHLARGLIGLGRQFEYERATIGLFAPAIAIAIYIAVGIEQRFRACRTELAHLGTQARIVAVRKRHDRALRDDRLPAPEQPDLFLD